MAITKFKFQKKNWYEKLEWKPFVLSKTNLKKEVRIPRLKVIILCVLSVCLALIIKIPLSSLEYFIFVCIIYLVYSILSVYRKLV